MQRPLSCFLEDFLISPVQSQHRSLVQVERAPVSEMHRSQAVHEKGRLQHIRCSGGQKHFEQDSIYEHHNGCVFAVKILRSSSMCKDDLS